MTILQPGQRLVLAPSTEEQEVNITNDTEGANGSYTIVIGENTPPTAGTLAPGRFATYDVPPQNQVTITNTGGAADAPLEVDY